MPGIDTSPIAISPTGLAQMEERKRPVGPDADDTAPPAKRQVTSGVNGDARSHQDADFPGKDDLERFQKEAILRQMQEYKREKTTLENQLSDLTAKAASHDDHVRHMDAWLWQLVDEVKVAIDGMDTQVPLKPFPSTLLSSSTQEFQDYLKSRSEAITAAIDQIFASKGEIQPDVKAMQERVAQLAQKEKSHTMEVEKLLAEKSQVEERLEAASMRYMMAEKKLDRAKSVTVAKLERQATAMSRSDPTTGAAEKTKAEKPEAEVDTEALAEAEKDKNAALAASAIQAQQLVQLEQDNANLRTRITTLTRKQADPSDEAFAQSDLFKQLSERHDEAVKKANNLEALTAEIREEITKLQAERTAYQTQVDTEAKASIGEKEQALDKAERDLARIRTARDELLAELQIRKAAQEQERVSFDQIRQQVAAREDRIKALELEIARKTGEGEKQTNGSLDELSLEELRTKHANLERQYAMLNTELVSMSDAYKKMSTANTSKVANLAEMEEKINRLGAEKTKADQKYFAAMKSKEAREQEVRTLRAQNTRSSDIISSLKDISETRASQVANFEKLVTEANLARSNLETKLTEAQSHIEQRRLQLEAAKKESDDLSALAGSKDIALTTATNAQRKLEVDVEKIKAEVASKDKKIEAWRASGLGGESEHYEMLRNLAICTVCRKNFKDTAIKTCGHVFCKECVEDRLSNRMRKCPNCNRAFGSNDYMRITM